MASIYDHPGTYDLEHSGPEPDIAFFVRRAENLSPRRILDLACGNGRITLPLARAARGWGGSVTGIDVAEEMLAAARTAPDGDLVEWRAGDARNLDAREEFDLVISGCASLSHLLTLADQLAVWRGVHAALAPVGSFLVAELMPDLPTLAESMRLPAKPAIQFDGDFENSETRLLRFRAATYRADLQRLRIRYLYDQFSDGQPPDRFLNDYDAHVYFPNELRLLFVTAGFVIEQEWGGYDGAPLGHASRFLILRGRKPSGPPPPP